MSSAKPSERIMINHVPSAVRKQKQSLAGLEIQTVAVIDSLAFIDIALRQHCRRAKRAQKFVPLLPRFGTGRIEKSGGNHRGQQRVVLGHLHETSGAIVVGPGVTDMGKPGIVLADNRCCHRGTADRYVPLPGEPAELRARFAGGAVGFLGYEMVRFFEPTVPAVAKDLKNCKLRESLLRFNDRHRRRCPRGASQFLAVGCKLQA